MKEKQKQVGIRMPVSLIACIEKVAKDASRCFAAQVRFILKEWLKNN